jgi:transcriptional regulator with XRE-family HTH domain
MKRTREDDAYAADFGRALAVEYGKAKKRAITDQVFARSIGVERAQLDKYLRGEAMPSVRTVALAYRAHKIAIPYDHVPVDGALSNQGRRRKRVVPTQLLLPFTIWAEGPESVDMKFKPVGTRKFELQVTVRKKSRNWGLKLRKADGD